MDCYLYLNSNDILIKKSSEVVTEITLAIKCSDCAGSLNALAESAQDWALGRALEACSFFDSLGRVGNEYPRADNDEWNDKTNP